MSSNINPITATLKKNPRNLHPLNFHQITDEELIMNHDFQPESEIVAQYIVEKLISMTLTYYHRNKVNEQIPEYCFNFFHKMLVSGLQEEYICFDRDDMFINKNLVEEPIFFDSKYYGLNDWSGLKQPESSKIDRSAASYIRVVKKEEPIKAPIKEEVDKERDTKSAHQGYMKTNYSTKTNFTKDSNKNLKLSSKNLQSNNSNQNLLGMRSQTGKLPNPAHLAPQFSLNIPDVPEEHFVMIAREEKRKALDKMVADVKQQEINRKANADKNLEMQKKNKELNLKNITTDVNGNPVQIKQVNVERLPDLYLTAKPTKKEENEVVVNQRSYVSMDQTKKLEKEVVSKEKEKLHKAALNTSLKTIINKNPEQEKPILPMPEKQVIVQPAGSNFDIFIPECGVTISEGNKQRTGGKDFYEKYKRHSMSNYKNIVNNTFQANYTASSLLGFDQTKEVMDKYNKDGNQSLPAVSARKTMFDQSSKSYMSSLQESTVKMNTKYGTIKNALDTLEPIHEFEEKKDLEDVIPEDIFKNRKFITLETESSEALDLMDKFNSNIMKNTQWGYDLAKKQKIKPILQIPHKPNVKKIENEIGKFVAKSKLPRARNYTKVHKDIIVRRDDHIAFYDEVLDSNIFVEEGGYLFLKNCTVNGDVENRGDIKTYGTVEFNGKIKSLTKIHSIKHKDTIVQAFNLS